MHVDPRLELAKRSADLVADDGASAPELVTHLHDGRHDEAIHVDDLAAAGDEQAAEETVGLGFFVDGDDDPVLHLLDPG
ncbi:hypothetical protein D3C72_2515150 [compost metagenome]